MFSRCVNFLCHNWFVMNLLQSDKIKLYVPYFPYYKHFNNLGGGGWRGLEDAQRAEFPPPPDEFPNPTPLHPISQYVTGKTPIQQCPPPPVCLSVWRPVRILYNMQTAHCTPIHQVYLLSLKCSLKPGVANPSSIWRGSGYCLNCDLDPIFTFSGEYVLDRSSAPRTGLNACLGPHKRNVF